MRYDGQYIILTNNELIEFYNKTGFIFWSTEKPIEYIKDENEMRAELAIMDEKANSMANFIHAQISIPGSKCPYETICAFHKLPKENRLCFAYTRLEWMKSGEWTTKQLKSIEFKLFSQMNSIDQLVNYFTNFVNVEIPKLKKEHKRKLIENIYKEDQQEDKQCFTADISLWSDLTDCYETTAQFVKDGLAAYYPKIGI